MNINVCHVIAFFTVQLNLNGTNCSQSHKPILDFSSELWRKKIEKYIYFELQKQLNFIFPQNIVHRVQFNFSTFSAHFHIIKTTASFLLPPPLLPTPKIIQHLLRGERAKILMHYSAKI